MTYLIDPPDRVYKQEQPLCRCQPVNPRHRESWHCLTKAELLAWYARHPEATCSVGTAKRLAALELEYGRLGK